MHTKKPGSWQSRSSSKCPREDKQTSAPKEKKSPQLVGKRAQNTDRWDYSEGDAKSAERRRDEKRGNGRRGQK